MNVTSAGANKLLKKLTEEKERILINERHNMSYVLADGETPDIPDYNFADTSAKIAEIDDKIVTIKHAINKVNTTNMIDVQGKKMTIDTVLVKMAQLNQRKNMLQDMRNSQKKVRLGARGLSSNAIVEYKYANYDIDEVNNEYLQTDATITAMQLALDKFNASYEFEVEITL